MSAVECGQIQPRLEQESAGHDHISSNHLSHSKAPRWDRSDQIEAGDDAESEQLYHDQWVDIPSLLVYDTSELSLERTARLALKKRYSSCNHQD